MISFKDLNLKFYILVFNTTIEFIMRIPIEQHFSIIFRPLTETIMILVN